MFGMQSANNVPPNGDPQQTRKHSLDQANKCFKLAIQIISVLLFISGVVSIAVGIAVVVIIKNNIPNPPHAITGVGIWDGLVVILFSIVGIISGSPKANANQLKTYSIFSVIAVALIIARIVLSAQWINNEETIVATLSWILLALGILDLTFISLNLTYSLVLGLCIIPELQGESPCCYCNIQVNNSYGAAQPQDCNNCGFRMQNNGADQENDAHKNAFPPVTRQPGQFSTVYM
uniref:Uncharacterized protein n=1 Tax=Ciona savignyi TaxID=51511 RepID=H2YWH0_CIOSA